MLNSTKPHSYVLPHLQITVRDEGYQVDHSFSLLSSNIEEVRAAFSRLARARTVLSASLKVEGTNLGKNFSGDMFT